MRINRYLATATGISRRRADEAIQNGLVHVNALPASLGQDVQSGDKVEINGQQVDLPLVHQTIMLHKPVGYVCSRAHQGHGLTIYDLLPPDLHRLKPIGRLDKDSSGLLLMTSDGKLAQSLGHPSGGKWKEYEVTLNRQLEPKHIDTLRQGIILADGMSKFDIKPHSAAWIVRLQEGRNRQIRRTFEALGYRVLTLHRTAFGSWHLDDLPAGDFKNLEAVI